MSKIARTASVAEFTKTFGQLSAAMIPGETMRITAHGKPVGRFVREGGQLRRRKLNIGERVRQLDYSERDGQRLIDAIVESQ